MIIYKVMLKNIRDNQQSIVLSDWSTRQSAELSRLSWRMILGNKKWHERSQGDYQLEHLVLIIETEET